MAAGGVTVDGQLKANGGITATTISTTGMLLACCCNLDEVFEP